MIYVKCSECIACVVDPIDGINRCHRKPAWEWCNGNGSEPWPPVNTDVDGCGEGKARATAEPERCVACGYRGQWDAATPGPPIFPDRNCYDCDGSVHCELAGKNWAPRCPEYRVIMRERDPAPADCASCKFEVKCLADTHMSRADFQDQNVGCTIFEPDEPEPGAKRMAPAA